jgi:hypothetical protein
VRKNNFSKSTRTVAEQVDSSGSYVQKVRDAVAWKYVSTQQSFFNALAPAKSANLQITLDETDSVVLMNDTQATRSMLMLHCTLTWTFAHTPKTQMFHFPLAPAFLDNKKASTIFKAVQHRMPFNLTKLREKAGHVSVSVGTDAARACKKLGLEFRRRTFLRPEYTEYTGQTAAHALCQMHAANNVVVNTVKPCNLTVPVFTSVCLLHKGWTFANLKSRCKRNMSVSFEYFQAPPPENEAYLRKVFSFLENYLSRDPLSEVAQSRVAASRRLASNLAASTFDSEGRIVQMRHFCPLGHHHNEEAALEEIRNDFETLAIPAPPGVPACNRWMVLCPAFGWWMAHFVLNLLPDELGKMAMSKEQEEKSVDVCDSEVDAFLGYVSDDSMRRKIAQQYKKTYKFITDALSVSHLFMTTATIAPLFRSMGSYLSRSKFKSAEKFSALEFVDTSSSPAAITFREYSGFLENENAEHWRLVLDSYQI